MDLSRFDAAPLIAFIAAKETNYGDETDGRMPRGCGAGRTNERADTQAGCFRFGCGLPTLNKWGTAHRDTDVVPDKELDLARENERLRRENRILKEQRDILKKA